MTNVPWGSVVTNLINVRAKSYFNRFYHVLICWASENNNAGCQIISASRYMSYIWKHGIIIIFQGTMSEANKVVLWDTSLDRHLTVNSMQTSELPGSFIVGSWLLTKFIFKVEKQQRPLTAQPRTDCPECHCTAIISMNEIYSLAILRNMLQHKHMYLRFITTYITTGGIYNLNLNYIVEL